MEAFIFVFGLLVTIVAGAAVATIWWAAINDGRTDAEMRERREREESEAQLRRVA